jgi:PKD repeat protein
MDGPIQSRGDFAVYIAFGRALGYMETWPGSGQYELLDVHGAGAQRSDPKSGNASDYPFGNGPQGDVVRIDNFVRLVRDASEGSAELEAAYDFAPLAPVENTSVQFEDQSTGEPDSWLWDFGDGATSSERHPSHAFEVAGTYSVRLNVSRDGEADAVQRPLTVYEAQACATTGESLCLLDRFRVELVWEDFEGQTGVGQAQPLTTDTGAFWFFQADNLELMIKVLDGRFLNDCFWVFYGALSTVEYTVTVTDSLTAASASYTNASGSLGSRADTAALCGL